MWGIFKVLLFALAFLLGSRVAEGWNAWNAAAPQRPVQASPARLTIVSAGGLQTLAMPGLAA